VHLSYVATHARRAALRRGLDGALLVASAQPVGQRRHHASWHEEEMQRLTTAGGQVDIEVVR
jgi:hypothetical protein